MEILGAPVVELEFAVDRPVAMVAVRLSDVAPDGRATRISYGLLNLTHRDGHERPQALVPGERYRVRVTLNAMAQALPPGHRLRLALSTSYWPLAWPAPRTGDADACSPGRARWCCRCAPTPAPPSCRCRSRASRRARGRSPRRRSCRAGSAGR